MYRLLVRDGRDGYCNPGNSLFRRREKIVYVHFRDVQGTVPCFNECFINEGNLDTLAVMRTLKEVGFTGFMIDDHVPHMIGDSPWGHRGRAYAIGYLTALLDIVNKQNGM